MGSFMIITLAGAAGDAETSAFGAAAASAFELAAASAFGAASLGVALACILQGAAAQAPAEHVERPSNLVILVEVQTIATSLK